MSSQRVVLIDSDTNFNQGLAAEITRHGWHAEAMADAAVLLDRKDDVPNLIVLCIDPKKTGWGVCNNLRKSATLKTVPLVVTSAEATEKDFEGHKKLKARAEEYLHKPFTAAALIEKMATYLGEPEPQAAAEDEAEAMEIPIEEDLLVEDDTGGGATSFSDDPEPTGKVTEAELEDLKSRARPVPGPVFNEDLEVTRVGDRASVEAETDAAFAALGGEETPHVPIVPPPAALPPSDPSTAFDIGQTSAVVRPMAESRSNSSAEIDLGLDQVAQQAAESAPAPRTIDVSAELEELRKERGRLLQELEETKAKAAQAAAQAPAPAGGFSREREFLNLREIINKKEKEILDLRDSLDGRDRQILDEKDKFREIERKSRELEEKLVAVERDLVTAKERIETVTTEKDRASDRERQNKTRVDELTVELETLKQTTDAERTRVEAEHQKAIGELRESGELEREGLRARHEAALAEATAQAERTREQLKADHAAELGELKNRHATEIKAVERRAADELSVASDAHRLELEKSEQQRKEEIETLTTQQQTRIAALEAQHKEEMEALADQFRGEKARLQQEQEDALVGADVRRKRDLAAAAEANKAEIERLTVELEQKRENELKAQKDEHQRKIEALTETHEDLKAGMQERHARQLEETKREAASELEKVRGEHAAEIEKLTTERNEKVASFERQLADRDAVIDDANTRIEKLNETVGDQKLRMAGMEQQIKDLEKQVEAGNTEIGEKVATIRERDAKIGELEAESARYQDQVLKAHERIKTDESAITRARKALGIAQILLDESDAKDSEASE